MRLNLLLDLTTLSRGWRNSDVDEEISRSLLSVDGDIEQFWKMGDSLKYGSNALRLYKFPYGKPNTWLITVGFQLSMHFTYHQPTHNRWKLAKAWQVSWGIVCGLVFAYIRIVLTKKRSYLKLCNKSGDTISFKFWNHKYDESLNEMVFLNS